MNRKRWIWWPVIVLAAVGIGYWLGHRSGGGSAETSGSNQKDPVAQVTLAPLQRKSIADTVTAYGSVITQPGKTHAVSVAYETRIKHLLVAPGEAVSVGQALVEIEPSAQTQLQLSEARNAAKAAQQELEQTQQRFSLKLATNQDFGVAKKSAETAQLQLQTLEKQGAASAQQVTSDLTGVVGKVDVQDGQIVPAGNPLVELVQQNEIEVKLGVEPEDVVHVKLGQPVTLYQVHLAGAQPVQGKVRLLTQRVDPDTRMVDVYVTLPNDKGLLLDSYFRAELKTQAHETFVVPRSAVLPEGDGYVLYTVEKEHAVQHRVQLGIQTALETEVFGKDLHAGEHVVVQGNYELSDGMAVAAEKKS
ncbi:MAG: efflux RND transporter periplasmic adaptor subunit [Chthoniobacterales bacterium]|nr:efflux RND transporter periplasmic adaptor subunit [Chthoniobacterales bacterium]